MRPECERCGASNRHIDEFVAQTWQCSACGAKNQYAPCTCCAPCEPDEPVCVACDANDEECVCDAPEPAPEFDANLFDDIPE